MSAQQDRTNDSSVTRVLWALRAYVEAIHVRPICPPFTQNKKDVDHVSDLLTDLMYYCLGGEYSFDDCLKNARLNFKAETKETCPHCTAATEALIDVLSHLVAAHSLLKRANPKIAPSNKMFRQMLKDYEASIERGRAAIGITLAHKPDTGATWENEMTNPVYTETLYKLYLELADILPPEVVSVREIELRKTLDAYGVALMMIANGCSHPGSLAIETLERHKSLA